MLFRSLAIFAFALGMIVGVRSAKRVLKHLEEPACDHGPEVAALTARFNQAQIIVLVLGFVILALMIYAAEGGIG